jgi:hypothetical protein
LATQLKNILYFTDFDSTPYEMMFNKLPDSIENLHTFGEIAIVHDGAHAKVRAKLQDKGLVAMFVRFPDNHAGEVCQFLNITTRRLISSRTAIFLHKTYAAFHNLSQELIAHIAYTELGDVLDETQNDKNQDDSNIADIPEPDEPFHNLVDDIPPELDEDQWETTITTSGLH